jgi:hypothetical protein
VLSGSVFVGNSRLERWGRPIAIFSFLCLGFAAVSEAQSPAVSVGAGLQTSFVHTEPEASDGTDAFNINDVRLYVNGTATENISFMFNTAYTGADNNIDLLDAVAQVSTSKQFNIWFGRFLPPSDRANLYGPFYAHHWNVYQDGVQDGYPFVYQGRQNGAMYWGQFGKVKVSGGGFDGASATGTATLIGAGRIQVDFWDPEDGYYLNSTYYGDKNLLALGLAGQFQGEDRAAYSVDFLLERKLPGGGAYTVEAEWARYDSLGGYNPQYSVNDGGYVLAAYLFPQIIGRGRFEALGKYAHARFREGRRSIDADHDQKTTELNLNYVIKQFNARVMLFYKDIRFSAVRPDHKQVGVGMQIQM